MATVDNSKCILEGIFTDVEIKIPAKTTYAVGTILARNADGDLTGYDSTAIENASTFYVLAQNIENTAASAASFERVRVLDGGVVDKNKLIFLHAADAEDEDVLDALRNNHFKLENVQQLAE